MVPGDIVYVIKWKYIDGKFTYYSSEMIYSGIKGHYIYCRNKAYKDRNFSTPWIYASTFSKYSNRVFETKEEAEENIKQRQIEHDLKKEIEEEFRNRINNKR